MSYIGLPFVVGDRISFKGEFGIIKVIDSEDDLAAIYYDTKRLVQYSLKELIECCRDRQLSIIKSVPQAYHGVRLTNCQKETIAYREAYCKAAYQHPNPCGEKLLVNLIPQITAEYHFSKQPGLSSVQRWYEAWVNDDFEMIKQVIGETDKTKRYRVPFDVEAIMSKAIDKIYLKKGLSPKAAIIEVNDELKSKGYDNSQIPCEKTIRNRIADLDRIGVERARKGDLAARELSRGGNKKHPEYACCERVELDVFHLNIGLLDDDGYFVGALTIAVVLDCGTRCILGFAALVCDKKTENAELVLESLLHSIKHKTDPLWIYSGIGLKYVRDSGPGYRSKVFNQFIENSLNSTLEVSAVRKGYAKPYVESLVRSLRALVDNNIEYYLGKYNPSEFSEATLIKSAKFTVKQVTEKLYNILLGYHHLPHSQLKANRTPHDEWVEKSNIRPPITLDQLPNRMLLRPTVAHNRTLLHVKGITYLYQWFNSHELQSLFHQLHGNRKANSIKVSIELNKYDARFINVIHPDTGERIEVANTIPLTYCISFAELNGHRSGIQNKLEVDPNILTKDRKKMRDSVNRRGPKTDVIPVGDTVDFNHLYTPGLSPHESIADTDKFKKKKKKELAEEKEASNSGESTIIVSPPTSGKSTQPESKYSNSNEDTDPLESNTDDNDNDNSGGFGFA